MISLIRESNLHKNRLLWLILVIALSVRIGAAVYWHRTATADAGFFRLGDSDGYWVLAGHIARGEPYQYGSENASVFRAPLMPLFLSPFTLIPNRSIAILSARCAGAAFGTLTVFLVAMLAWQTCGLVCTALPPSCKLRRRAALFAGLVATLHPSAIGISIVVLSEMVFVPLMLVYLLLWSRWLPIVWNRDHSQAPTTKDSNRTKCGRAFWRNARCLVSLCNRCRRWISDTDSTELATVHTIRAGVGVFDTQATASLPTADANCLDGSGASHESMVVPQLPPNRQVCIDDVAGGPTLYDSFHSGASGGSDEGMSFMREIEDQQAEEDRQSLLANPTQPLEGTLEWRINRRAGRLASWWCWQHPAEVLKLAWAKLCRTWNVWPNGGDVGSPLIRLAISMGSLFVVLLALLGSLKLWMNNPALIAICWSPCLYFTLLHMVFVGSVRYREPAIVVLVAVAGCALANLFSHFDSSTKDCSRAHSAVPDSSAG